MYKGKVILNINHNVLLSIKYASNLTLVSDKNAPNLTII